jgi:hypothetical protein
VKERFRVTMARNIIGTPLLRLLSRTSSSSSPYLRLYGPLCLFLDVFFFLLAFLIPCWCADEHMEITKSTTSLRGLQIQLIW